MRGSSTRRSDRAVIEAAVEFHTDPELILSAPALEGAVLKAFSMAGAPLAEAIAARTGAGPRRGCAMPW